MNLYIKELAINENELITVDVRFCDGLTVIENSPVTRDVIAIISGEVPQYKYTFEINFRAKVLLDDIYYVEGKNNYKTLEWKISVCKEDGKDCTREYFDLLCGCEEIASTNYFDFSKDQNYPERLAKYLDIETHYPDGNFCKITNGYGGTRSFRAFMRQYIKHFKQIRLNTKKEYFLKLSCDGKFFVDHENNTEIFLSESEDALFQYLCFLCITDFWARAERIRNLNLVNKPLVICNFIEILDESIDLTEVLQKTDKIPRQTIIFVPTTVQPNRYNIFKR